MEREEPGDFHPIMNEWGETCTLPRQVRVVWAIHEPVYVVNLHKQMSPELSLLLACLKRNVLLINLYINVQIH
jgi:hypothetical protein